MRCYVCLKPGDLRPYGEDGQPICFPCMTSDPERVTEAKAQFQKVLESGPVVLTDKGPIKAK